MIIRLAEKAPKITAAYLIFFLCHQRFATCEKCHLEKNTFFFFWRQPFFFLLPLSCRLTKVSTSPLFYNQRYANCFTASVPLPIHNRHCTEQLFILWGSPHCLTASAWMRRICSSLKTIVRSRVQRGDKKEKEQNHKEPQTKSGGGNAAGTKTQCHCVSVGPQSGKINCSGGWQVDDLQRRPQH